MEFLDVYVRKYSCQLFGLGYAIYQEPITSLYNASGGPPIGVRWSVEFVFFISCKILVLFKENLVRVLFLILPIYDARGA